MPRPASPAWLHDPDLEPPEGEFARFFSYSHDVLAILDEEGCVLLVSPSVERVLGHPIDGVMGRHALRWVHPDDRARVRATVRSLLEGRPIADLDSLVLRADGSWVPMRWSLSLGPGLRVYGVGHDRTHRVQHQEALLSREMAELRLRAAMELHDGVLQTLTGASLHIEVARRLVRSDPAAAEEVLEALGETVSAEQREMRLYVDEVKGQPSVWTDGDIALPTRIESIIDRVGLIWGVETSVDARLSGEIPAPLGRHILRIVQEATVNAARHGAAQEVSVSVTRDGPDVSITIADNGRGFPFMGEYDNEALRKQRRGPLSLKHRVAEAGGSIRINSTPGGSMVFVRLPLFSEDAE
jgi:PAS domain S-box-containing protein